MEPNDTFDREIKVSTGLATLDFSSDDEDLHSGPVKDFT
jgi:hypothetical protein